MARIVARTASDVRDLAQAHDYLAASVRSLSQSCLAYQETEDAIKEIARAIKKAVMDDD